MLLKGNSKTYKLKTPKVFCIDVSFDQSWAPGSRMPIPPDQVEKFVEFLVKVYRLKLEEAIRIQRFKRTWAPLDIEYVEAKRRLHLSTNMWEATGFFRDHIVAYQVGPDWVVGPEKGVRHPDSGIPIIALAKILEYGSVTRGIPPRPLFRPLTSYMRKHVQDYWKLYQRLK